MVQKSRDAFRTISEVAEWLDVPTHVLRFWESRFSQIKPVKRAGGRRYYRPSDMRVIGGVKTLLHDQGMTIRGVQKLFREEGVKHVSSFAPILHGEDDEAENAAASAVIDGEAAPAAPAPPALNSRDATPDPTIDPTPVSAEEDEGEEDIADKAPVFAHSARVASGGEAAKAEPDAPAEDAAVEVQPEDGAIDPDLPFLTQDMPVEAAAAEAETEDAPIAEPEPPRPSIPPTPDVPDTDPADDDPSFQAPAGIAARLALIPPNALAAHRADLVAAAERLKSVLDRAG